MITYYEFMQRNLQGCIMHPDTLKSIEKVHYSVEHNLPIRRQVLVPELLEDDIKNLPEEERRLI